MGGHSLRVLIACEFSGIVREAFAAHGHDAWSCDLLPSEQPGQHYQRDVRELLGKPWDLMIAFPPCTYLCNSGARWWKDRQREQQEALAFVRLLLDAPMPRVCVENPEGRISTAIRKPDQYIHPWEYGHGEEKKTGLWLKNLPLLQPTQLMAERVQRVWRMGQTRHRSQDRSRTYPRIAAAMSQQWGALAPPPERC